eukprot:TRINITY_DN2629_c0_g1_i2.p1 TRINITY_DN2629_c0_g1~~TRINITY_DN2629_c0_g1_i2.p1  ORF type:complete len:421 (+),score=18.32 TRINITY_DN2629_c0_g1_i2:81-1265(+)
MDKRTFFVLLILILPFIYSSHCELCKNFITLFHKATQSQLFKQSFLRVESFLCNLFGGTEDICVGIVVHMTKVFLEILPDKYFNATYDCTALGFCEDFKIQTRDLKWFQSKTLRNSPPSYKQPANSKNTFRVVQITDLHMDPFYAMVSSICLQKQNVSANCGEPTCCKADSGPPKNDMDRSGYWGGLGKCDVPERTVESAIKFVAHEINPDIVLWLGDSMYNPFYNVSMESEHEILQTITTMFKREFGKKPIFPLLGNHEGFPIDTFNVHNISKEAWLLDMTTKLWEDWLDDAAREQYNRTGYYTQTVPFAPKLRIVALNTFPYMDNNIYTMVNSTDPLGQLQWLESVLSHAEKDEEGVLVLEHVPSCSERGSEGFLFQYIQVNRVHRSFGYYL